MIRFKLGFLILALFLMQIQHASAGPARKKTQTKKVKLTTYYPVPNAEYKNLKTTTSFVIPVKDVDGNANNVEAGEIWVEQTTST